MAAGKKGMAGKRDPLPRTRAGFKKELKREMVAEKQIPLMPFVRSKKPKKVKTLKPKKK